MLEPQIDYWACPVGAVFWCWQRGNMAANTKILCLPAEGTHEGYPYELNMDDFTRV
jgi:hypothetical protein